jgi:hypothetical protein
MRYELLSSRSEYDDNLNTFQHNCTEECGKKLLSYLEKIFQAFLGEIE